MMRKILVEVLFLQGWLERPVGSIRGGPWFMSLRAE